MGSALRIRWCFQVPEHQSLNGPAPCRVSHASLTQGTRKNDSNALGRDRLRRAGADLRHRHGEECSLRFGWQCPDAGNRRRHPGRRFRLPQSSVQDHRARRCGRHHRARPAAGLAGRHRLRDRCRAFRCHRLHRHERFRSRQRPHHGSCPPEPGCRPVRRVPRRCRHRHAGCRSGPAGLCRLLRRAAEHGHRGP